MISNWTYSPGRIYPWISPGCILNCIKVSLGIKCNSILLLLYERRTVLYCLHWDQYKESRDFPWSPPPRHSHSLFFKPSSLHYPSFHSSFIIHLYIHASSFHPTFFLYLTSLNNKSSICSIFLVIIHHPLARHPSFFNLPSSIIHPLLIL